jgi:outer membrane protein
MIASFVRPAVCASVLVMAAASAQAQGRSIDLQVGGAATISPKYEGSKDYEVRGFPIVAPVGSGEDGMVQFRGIDDVRFRLFQFNGFEAGPLAGYRFGRDEDDAELLEGLGDVDGAFVLGAYAAYNFGFIKPFVSYHHGVSGDDTGALLRFGAETKFPVCEGVAVTLIGGATYADSDYNDSYFSISQSQSDRSDAGLGSYDASSGIKDVYLGVSTDIPLTDVWSLKLAGKYSHLVGDAADSPIVETDSQFTGLVGLTYRFMIER